MEEEVSSYLERDVEDEDLFYLENGLTISNVRDLLIKVQDMDEATFNTILMMRKTILYMEK